MMIMPVVMFFMFMNFPSGLALYWLTNNLFSIGQQRAIQYHDKHGKSGFKITALVALGVFVISWLCTLI
jgi:membrane protein insertase Oxa1/YidC/SpoIIIJ